MCCVFLIFYVIKKVNKEKKRKEKKQERERNDRMEKKKICLDDEATTTGDSTTNIVASVTSEIPDEHDIHKEVKEQEKKEEEEEEKKEEKKTEEEIGIIDIRSREDFEKGHLAGATSLPADVLPQLLCALPPRDINNAVKLALATSSDDTAQVAEAQRVMESSGYAVTRVIRANEDFTDKSPSRRIWRPNSSLECVVGRIEDLARKDKMPLTALDIACGSGRDAVFLATRGWSRTVGMDYQQRLLDCAVLLAKYEGCPDGSVAMENVDVYKLDPEVYKERYTLVHFARFLHRPMLAPETGVIPKLVAPGGFLVCHTFMEPCKKPGKPQFLLKKNELLELFRDTFGWEIVEYQETHLHDGRPIQFLCARKPFN